RLEDLTKSIEEQGIHVARTRQVLAENLNARYCSLAVTDGGLAAAACEYASPADALAGRARSQEIYDRIIPDRQLYVNGLTLLTLAPVGAGTENQARLIAATFAALNAH